MESDYTYYDLDRFICLETCKRLESVNVGVSFLKQKLSNIHYYSKFIRMYPNIKCEMLEYLYFCMRSISAVNPLMADDLLKLGWRGIVWLSFLALIKPSDNDYIKVRLSKYQGYDNSVDWLVSLALSEKSNNQKNADFLALTQELKFYLDIAPRLFIPLRLFPTDEQIYEHKARSASIKIIYQNEGLAAAHECWQNSRKYDWELSFDEWLLKVKTDRQLTSW